MRILVLAHSTVFGGAQISTLEFLELLTKHSNNGIELRVVTCNDAKREFIDYIESLNVMVYRVPCHFAMNYPVMSIREARSLVEWADVVWIADEVYLTALRVKSIRDIPVVAHLHSYALLCHWWSACYGLREVCLEKCNPWRITRCKQSINMELSRIGLLSSTRTRVYWLLDFVKGPLDFAKWRAVMKNVVDNIDGFIAVSNASWNIHVKHIPELEEKLHVVVYNPVTEPLKHVKPDPNEPYRDYILYASGSNLAKGPHILLDTWSIVSRELRDLKLYMIGCKDSWVEKYAKRLGLSNVIFLDKLPPNDNYYRVMYKARAVVMPSIVPETFGRIPIEANKLGVPAVVSDRGALPEIIENGVTGEVSEVDSYKLADAIARVVSSSWDRSRIIDSVSKRINPMSIASKLLDFLTKMMN